MVSNCPFFPWCQIVLFTFMVLKLSRILHIMIPLRWSLCWWSPDVGTDDGSREDWFALNRWFCPKPDQIKSHRTRPSCATTYTTPSCFNVSSDHSLVQQYASKNNLNCLIIFSYPSQLKNPTETNNGTIFCHFPPPLRDIFVIQKLRSHSFGASQSCRIYFLPSRIVEVPYILWNNF